MCRQRYPGFFPSYPGFQEVTQASRRYPGFPEVSQRCPKGDTPGLFWVYY